MALKNTPSSGKDSKEVRAQRLVEGMRSGFIDGPKFVGDKAGEVYANTRFALQNLRAKRSKQRKAEKAATKAKPRGVAAVRAKKKAAPKLPAYWHPAKKAFESFSKADQQKYFNKYDGQQFTINRSGTPIDVRWKLGEMTVQKLSRSGKKTIDAALQDDVLFTDDEREMLRRLKMYSEQ